MAVTEPDGLDAFFGHLKAYKTAKWYLYDVGNQFSSMWIDRGQLNLVSGDSYQDSMSIQAIYPKRPVQLPTTNGTYLHITYEVQRIETDRHYENLSLCGSDTVGETYVGDRPKAAPWPKPNFMNPSPVSRMRSRSRTRPCSRKDLRAQLSGRGHLRARARDEASRAAATCVRQSIR